LRLFGGRRTYKLPSRNIRWAKEGGFSEGSAAWLTASRKLMLGKGARINRCVKRREPLSGCQARRKTKEKRLANVKIDVNSQRRSANCLESRTIAITFGGKVPPASKRKGKVSPRWHKAMGHKGIYLGHRRGIREALTIRKYVCAVPHRGGVAIRLLWGQVPLEGVPDSSPLRTWPRENIRYRPWSMRPLGVKKERT